MYLTSYFNPKNKTFNLVIYLHYDDLSEDLDKGITEWLYNNISPTNAYIYFPKELEIDKIESILNRIVESVSIIKFRYDLNGIDHNSHKNGKDLIKFHKEHVFKEIFNKNDSLLKANKNACFEMQSGYLSNYFIRIGNMLIDSEHIEVLSIYMIEIISKHKYIYVDTATILPLVYCTIANITKDPLFKKTNILPKIFLFNSSDINSIELKSIESFFIISTTINGNLPKRLSEIHRVSHDKILVLFSFEIEKAKLRYEAHFQDYDRVLLGNDYFSVSKDNISDDITSFIPIDNDLFIPTNTNIKTILLNKDDAPSFVNEFQIRYGKTLKIDCYSSNINSGGFQRDIYFNISDLLKDSEQYFYKKLSDLVISQMPREAIIIYLGDKESESMADLMKTSDRYVFSEKDAKGELTKLEKQTRYNFYIIASCVSNGKKITNISMMLREFDNSSIHYVVGFFRCKDKKIEHQIKSNLKYGRYGFNTYNLTVIENIYLPNESSESLDWFSEQTLIKELLSINSEFTVSNDAKLFLEKRQNILLNGNLRNELFWDIKFDCNSSESNCTRFLLNKNFAFFSDRDWTPTEVTQSQVYFSILSILHNYRLTKGIKQSLHEKYLLDPENFIRYNDSIIRATLLRASSPEELNYTLDNSLSNKMRDVILNILETQVYVGSRDYCVIYEFLLSIAIRKLRLTDDDLERILSRINSDEYSEKDYILNFFEKFLAFKILKRNKEIQFEFPF